MKRVLVLGAGKIGAAVGFFLNRTGDYEVTLADLYPAVAEKAAEGLKHVVGKAMNLDDAALMSELYKGQDAVLSCLPFDLNPKVAELAREHSVHYLDLTEDVAVTRRVRELSEGASTAFIPQCGLAPGFITIVAFNLLKKLDEVERLKMRVGALPLYPSNMLKYNITWSVEGLINEYGNMCEAIVEGRRTDVLPLEGYETFVLDGIEYEAFNTSGGLGTLCDTLDGKVRYLDYKSIRYPGHNALARFLMNDLKMNSDRDTLKRIFENALPVTPQDVIVIYTTASGTKDGKLVQHTYSHRVMHQEVDGRMLSGIQVTTATGVCAVLDLLLLHDHVSKQGFVKLEEIDYDLFINNRFGRYYAKTGG